MISYATPRFWQAYSRLDEAVQKRAKEAYRLFQQDPYHPSLRFRKVHPTEPI